MYDGSDMAADRPTVPHPGLEGHDGADGVVDAGEMRTRSVEEPAGQVPHVDDLRGGSRSLRDEHRPRRIARSTRNPSTGSIRVVTRTSDQPGSSHQQPITECSRGGLLTGCLGLAVLPTSDLVSICGGHDLGILVGAARRMRGVDADRRDVRPVSSAPAERLKGVADEAWLPRDLDDLIPLTVRDRVVGSGLTPVSLHPSDAVGDGTALPPRQAGDVVPARHALLRQLASHPSGAAEHEDPHERCQPRRAVGRSELRASSRHERLPR